MSHQSAPAPLKWRSTAVLMELTRTIKDHCVGELLYAVPALLKTLEDKSPGMAADDICMMLERVYFSELEETRFPSFVKSCKKFAQNKAIPKKKDSALRLLKQLLEIRANLRSEGMKVGPTPTLNLRSSIVSSRSRSSSKKTYIGKSRKNSRGAKNIRKPNRLFRRNASKSGSVKRPSSSMQSVESAGSTDDGRRGSGFRSDFDEIIKSEAIMSPLRQYGKADIQVVLLFILSSFHNKNGLLPREKVEFWLQLAGSPMFKSRAMVVNQLHSDFMFDPIIPKYRLLVLDEVISFIWRNSMAKSFCGKAFGPLLFGCKQHTKEFVSSGRLFNRILFTCDILLPTKAVVRHRIWDVNSRDKITSEEEVQDSTYYLKKQLINFYLQRKEKRYTVVVDQLFELYKFKDIVLGVYNKYHCSIEEWTNKVRDKVNATDLADLELTSNRSKNIRDFRARNHSSSFLTGINNVESKMQSKIRAIETGIIDQEVDFNERLRMLDEKFVRGLDKQAHKYRGVVFNSDFYALLDASNKLAVRLEVLNLVRKPVLNSLYDLSSRSVVDQNASHPAELLRSQRAVALTRYNLLCDIYLDHLESLYHGYTPYILHFQHCKQYVEEKEPVANRGALGSIRDSARSAVQKTIKKAGKLNKRTNASIDHSTTVNPLRHRNHTQPPRPSGKLSERNDLNRSVSMHTGAKARRAAGKLTGEDRLNGKNLLTAKRDTRKLQSKKRTGSILSVMKRPKKNLVYLFSELQETEECFKDQTLFKILSHAERRFKEIRTSFTDLERNLHKTDPVARKAKKVVKLVKELESCLDKDRASYCFLERQMGVTEVEKCRKLMIQRVKIEVEHITRED